MKRAVIASYQPVISGMSTVLQKELTLELTAADAEELLKKTGEYFEQIIVSLPEVGADNPWLKSLLGVAFLSGLWLELERKGWSINKISVLTQKALYTFTKQAIPHEKFKNIRDTMCSTGLTQSIAQRSQQSVYSDDWFVESVVPKSSTDRFQCGYNVYRCPIKKFCHQNNIERFFPYFCLDDYVMHAAMGIHLSRTQTLAHDASYCDFRLTAMEEPFYRVIYDPEKLKEFQK